VIAPALLAALAVLVQESPPTAVLLARLRDPARAESAWAGLLERGESSALAALEGFAGLDASERRARALLVREVGREACVEGVLSFLDDPDAAVRREGLLFLARPELRDEALEPRVAALARSARDDADGELRGQAVAALGRIDRGPAAEALLRLVTELPSPERAAAARALAGQPSARERLVERVIESFSPATPPASRLADDVLAVLAGAPYGQALAEVPAGGTNEADLRPFLSGARHPDARVREAGADALERFVQRARFLGEAQRASDVLARLAGRGLDDDLLLARRARLALEVGGREAEALAAARSLAERARRTGGIDAERRRGQAGLLEAAALCAAGRFDEVDAVLESTAAALERVLAERLDLRSSARVMVHVDMLERRALVELYAVLAALGRSGEVERPQVLLRARAAHEYSLRAQLALIGQWTRVTPAGSYPNPWGLDSLIGDELSPWRLVLGSPRAGGLDSERALVLQRGLCVALASVAPLELPGFTPLESVDPTLGDPTRDPRRRELLVEILSAYLAALLDMAELATDPLQRAQLARLLAQLEAERARDEGTTWRVHLRQRLPSDAALPLAEELRAEGRVGQARALAEKLQADMAAAEELLRGAWGEDLEARADVLIGSTWMDEGEPRRAEEFFGRALDRLEVLEDDLRERGLGAGGLDLVAVRKADVLVSLAVNANVKLRDVDRALEYFERAYALREDDFMRVLLACYRARAGRQAEARAVLRDLPVAPANYYNLACTYALLGELELGLDYLRRDFAELRTSPGQLERQKTWARDDPDLENLRGDPRFESLVAADPTKESDDQ
jgi:tetratricopeptide (TPR) repeat protein